MAIKSKSRLDAFGTGDPAVDAALGEAASPPPKKTTVYDHMARARSMTPAQRRKVEFDRNRTKGSYDLPPDMIAIIDQLSVACKAPRAHIVAYLIAYGLNDLLEGKAQLSWAVVGSPNIRFCNKVKTPEYPSIEDLQAIIDDLASRW